MSNIRMYTETCGFQEEISSLDVVNDYEGKVNGIWGAILYHYFNSDEGYITRAQDRVVKGYLDFHTVQWKHRLEFPNRVQHFFLITQCKRPARDVGEEAWKEGKEQLARYFRGQSQFDTAPTMPFGIVAVGRRCTFFEYAPNEELHTMTGTREKYDLLDNANDVHRQLVYIKNFH